MLRLKRTLLLVGAAVALGLMQANVVLAESCTVNGMRGICGGGI